MTVIPKPSSPNSQARYPVSCSYKQGQALRVSWKNHPRPEGLRYFSRKPCTVRRVAVMAARIGHRLLCPIRIMIMEKIEYDNIPEWAIYALEYGISDDMSLDDEHQTLVSEFIKSNFPNGYIMEVLWNKYTGFDRYPAFGKPCGTYSVNFWIDNQLK